MASLNILVTAASRRVPLIRAFQDALKSSGNRGRVIVRGKFAPVVGRVSMDLTLIDVTDVPGAQHNDQVTLLGSDGELTISAEEIAETAATISYEITCGISHRVPRIYLNKR